MTTDTTPPTTPAHWWLCHPEDAQAPAGPPTAAPEPEKCWHCDTTTTMGACTDCETCTDARELTGAVYHCQTCGRWWGYVQITPIPL
jgi:hypothetical protein